MKPSETFLKKSIFFKSGKKKKLLLSTHNVEKRLRFATEHVSFPLEYLDDIIFSDDTEIMLYYQRVWRKHLTALENKSLIPTVKLSVMVFSKVVGVIRILDEIITKEVYPDT